VSQTQTVQASKPNFSHLSELIYSVGFYNRYIDQFQNKRPKTGWNIPGQPGEDEYGCTQGQRGYPIEGSSRRPGDPRVQCPSNRPDPHPSHSIPLPMAQERHYCSCREVSNPIERESLKGDKYSRKPPNDIFNPYSLSSRPPANHADLSSRRWEEEDSSDDSDSSAGSGSETASLSPRLGRGIQRRGGHEIRSRAPPILTRPTLDSYHGSSNPAGLSKSKPQQPWVAEPSDYKEIESARLPAQPSSSRADPRGRRKDTNFVVGSHRGEVGGGISGHPSDSQSPSSHKEKESARLPPQPSSSRADPQGRKTDTNFVVGSYRGEVGGGISGHPSDSQSPSSHKEKESARLPPQPSSSRADPQGKKTDTNFVVGSYRGEVGGGISGHPSDSRNPSSHKEKESARKPPQPSSSRADPRGRRKDTNFVVGSYRGEVGGGISGHPSDSQSPSSHKKKESARLPPQPSSWLPMQPSSNRPDSRGPGRGADMDFVLGSYRGEASQSVTVQANLGGSSNIAGSRTPRGATPIQGIQGAIPIPRFQPTNITSATSSISSRSPSIWTSLKRVCPILFRGLRTPDAPQLHGTENVANQSSEHPAEAVHTHDNAPLTSTIGIQKSGKSSVASSSARKVRPQKIDAPKKL
jgi:hypothetical protein